MDYKIKFPLEEGTFCLLVNLRNYLKYYQIHISEELLSGLLGYMGFFYTDQAVASLEIVHGRRAYAPGLMASFQQSLAEPLLEKRTPIGSDLLVKLDSKLEQQMPMLLWINDKYLAHSEYYGKADYWSLVIPLAISERQITYFDNGVREIGVEEFYKAINLDGQAKWHYTEQSTLVWTDELGKVLAQGLAQSIESMTLADETGETGLVAMEQMMQDLSQSTDLDYIYNLFYQLNRPGGLTITREVMGKLLLESKEAGILSEDFQTLEIYERLRGQWRTIANLLFKLSRTNDTDLQQRIVNRVQDNILLEKEGLLGLRQIVNHLEGGCNQ